MIEPDYECIMQYLTFRGESLPELLREIATYTENNYASVTNFVIGFQLDDYGEWVASFGYDYEHITLDQCKKAVNANDKE